MRDNVLLKVENLTVDYKEHRIIENVNVDIEKGRIYSIIGPNGCGKTTFLRAISRNIKPKEGRVLLDNVSIFSLKTKKVARKMAVLFQTNDAMSDVTVRNLVEYGRFAHKKWWKGTNEEDNRIVDWAIKKTGLSDLVQRRINTLSGGERQRAWIAMSIAQKPEILLLDEPTTYLDISHQLEIMELIESLNREEGITIVMVLHDLNHAARYSDDIMVFKEGKLHSKGNPWEVLRESVLEDVFHVKTHIMNDGETNRPVFYAKKVVDINQ